MIDELSPYNEMFCFETLYLIGEHVPFSLQEYGIVR